MSGIARFGMFFSRALAALLVLAAVACTPPNRDSNQPKPQFNYDGLPNHVVIGLYEYQGAIYAGTDRGLYVRSGNAQWSSRGLVGKQVLAMVHFGADHYLASVREVSSEGIFTDRLMETVSGGADWYEVEHNFGGEDPETLFGLYYDRDNNALYATGVEALAASYDEGRSWVLLDGIWDGFGQPKSVVRRNPATNEIWYGGQNALEQMVLERYSLDTQESTSFRDLLPSPAVIYGIRFDPEKAGRLYVSGEGGVLKSDDNGDTWETLIGDVDYRFYFDIALDPTSDWIYTAGWDKNFDTPQPLILEISTSGGKTWKQYQHPDTQLFGGVRSMLAVAQGDKTLLLLGLYGGGVMRVTLP